MKQLLFISILALLAINLSAFTIHWTGNTSTSWNVATNWNPNNVPTYADDAWIDNGCTRYPVINTTTLQCRDMTIASSATLTLTTATMA